MSRSQRLLALIQALRRYRRPVAGAALAEEFGISLRTLYRDVESLKALGAPIDGEAGVGYVLRPGLMLPPLMFSDAEIEALVLGSRWVSQRTDGPLADAARNALAKIAAVLPDDLRESLDATSLLIGPGETIASGDAGLVSIRAAIRAEHKLRIGYADGAGAPTVRAIWPFALAFFDQVRIVVAWCELRRDYRHFRIDRIRAIEATGERYPRRRQALLKEWRGLQGVAEQ